MERASTDESTQHLASQPFLSSPRTFNNIFSRPQRHVFHYARGIILSLTLQIRDVNNVLARTKQSKKKFEKLKKAFLLAGR